MTFEEFWIKIENRSQYLTKFRNMPESHSGYIDYWKEEKRKVIEGMWGKESKGYRYCPGTLYFYANFFTILNTDKRQKTRVKTRPTIRTVEWVRAYNYLVCQGFSGFENDEEFSCDEAILDAYKLKRIKESTDSFDKERYKNLSNSKGLKTYVHPLVYCRKLFNKSMGKALYMNNALNMVELGCLGGDVGLRMFDGSVKLAKDIKVGDKLMGVDSNQRTVLETFTGNNLLYEVNSKYNKPYVISDTHTLINNKDEFVMVEDALYNRHSAKITSVEYPEKEVMWHPYLMGLWLGDGFKREKMICGAYDDIEVLDWLKTHVDSNPHYERYHITQYVGSLGTKLLWRFNWIDSRMKYKNNWFALNLRNNKKVLPEYIINSMQNRLELLAGMIDSDGSLEGNRRFTISNTDYEMILKLQEVARSCGFRTYIGQGNSGITNSLKYSLRITGDIWKIPTKIPRKQAVEFKAADNRPNIIDIKPLGVGKFYGIEVDVDNLLVLEDYTITHNSRGGGKSYWYSGLAAREILIDGTKYYNPEFKPQIYVAVGSEKSDKSQDLAVKIKEGIDALAEDTTLGVYGSFGDNNYTPNPLYKNMVGDITSNNKENYYRHVYKVMYKGELIPKGTKSGLYHFSYSIQKKNGAESAVGTRLNLSIIEEVGVTPNAIEIHNANIQCFKTDEDKFGVEIYTGTSGNMETVQAAKKLFESPKTYNCLEFDNFYEGKGSIGFFLPSYMIDGNFIDEDGNTDVPAAKAHYEKLHNDAPAEKIDSIRMDKPIVPADMWIQKSKSIFPKEQIKKRYNQLLLIKNQGNQEKFRRFVKLLWQENKVIHEYIDPKKATSIDSFFESQGKNSDKNKNTKSTDCDIITYEEPSKNLNDKLYFFTLDTYVADEQDEGESLGCFQVWKSDFNVSKGETGNILVCEYTAKPDSRNTFYENIEKIIAWYGNPRRKLMFEANRGYDKVVEFFKKRGKEYLMSFSPNKYSNTWKSKITQTYGYLIGAKENKLETLNQFSEWLKESTILEDGEKLNLERLNSLGLLSELLNYDLEDDMGKKANYDRIMASLGFIIGQREAFNIFKEESVNPDENIYNAFVKRLTKTKK